MIHEHRLNRIVVASCTPRTHEPLFRDTLRQAGLNQYLFELANIRDQCSWVHSAVPEAATQKAAELVKMSIARARRLVPLRESSFAVTQTGLVIGGGVSGMTAALALADQGFKVHLVERSGRLGGNFLNLSYHSGARGCQLFYHFSYQTRRESSEYRAPFKYRSNECRRIRGQFPGYPFR